jgi:hypothetical protein
MPTSVAHAISGWKISAMILSASIVLTGQLLQCKHELYSHFAVLSVLEAVGMG